MAIEEDKFPVGMRVLVVDDDPTCLRLIETLLLKCQYNVTTTTRATEALRMLKEDKKRFDIVITDVHMPDMDGIKLLQLVGLEMDLPVIMLSAYGETKEVMKGIRNGACDFLLKPVRIQELQNIWQHVVRKNKSLMLRKPPLNSSSAADHEDGSRTRKSSAHEADDSSHQLQRNSMEDTNGGENNGYDDDDDDDELGRENDNDPDQEPTSRKKTRLFWSVELHQKFVDAVNQLGHDKAFPKKILDLMNVEGLTREKVASHLQKYRLYLKKMNAAATASSQARNRVGGGLGLGPEDRHLRSLGLGGGYGVFRSLAGSARFSAPQSSSLTHIHHAQAQAQAQAQAHTAGGIGMLGQLNTGAGLSIGGLSSSAMLQRSQFSNLSNSNIGKFEPMSMTANQTNPNPTSLFQGIPPTLQQTKAASNLLCSSSGMSSLLHGNPSLNTRGFVNQPSLVVNQPSLGVNPASSEIVALQTTTTPTSDGPIPNLLSSAQPSLLPHSFHPNPFPSGNGISQVTPNIQDDALDLFCGIPSLDNSKGNLQSQGNLNAASTSNNLGSLQSWQDLTPNYILNSCNFSGGLSSQITDVSPFDQTLSQSNNNMSPLPYSQLECVTTSHGLQQEEVQKSIGDPSLRFNENLMQDDPKLTASTQNGSEYLEDIVERFLKQGNGEMEAGEEDFNLDSFPIY